PQFLSRGGDRWLLAVAPVAAHPQRGRAGAARELVVEVARSFDAPHSSRRYVTRGARPGWEFEWVGRRSSSCPDICSELSFELGPPRRRRRWRRGRPAAAAPAGS